MVENIISMYAIYCSGSAYFDLFTDYSDRKHVCQTERLVCIPTDRLTDIQISGWSIRQIDGQIDNQIDIARSTLLMMLIQNIYKYTIYTLWYEMSPTMRLLLAKIKIPSARI